MRSTSPILGGDALSPPSRDAGTNKKCIRATSPVLLVDQQWLKQRRRTFMAHDQSLTLSARKLG